MGIVGNDSSTSVGTLLVRRVRFAIHEEHTVHHDAVFLVPQACQLTAISHTGLIEVEQVVGKGQYMIGITFSTRSGNHFSGHHRSEGKRVAMIDIAEGHACGIHLHIAVDINYRISVDGILDMIVSAIGSSFESTLHHDTVRYDERIVERVIVITDRTILRRARRRILGIGIIRSTRIDRVALQPYLYRPVFVRFLGYERVYRFVSLAFVIGRIGHEFIFVSSGGIEHELQFLQAGSIVRRTSGGITTRRLVCRIVNRDTRVGRRIRLDIIRRIELVCTHINLAVLNTLRERHIIRR